MALPKGKVSKARGRKRRANWKLSLPGIVECPQCHEKKLSHRVCKLSAPGIVKCPRCQQMKLAHRICKHCGYYDGKQVINMEAETASEK